jgi:putative transposase
VIAAYHTPAVRAAMNATKTIPIVMAPAGAPLEMGLVESLARPCLGLAESAAEFFPEAAWQRCIVHWYRNIFSHVPSTKVREIAAMLKAIHAGEDIVAAREKVIRVIEKLRALRLTRAADLVEAAVEETLAYYAFPEEHWRRIRTNNPLERILREIRRRTRVVGAFPDGQSALNLAAARLRHIAGTAWSTKRYLNIELLRDQQMRGAITA